MALAEPLIRDYRAVRIEAPLREALKRKKSRMETALVALTEAAGYEIRAVTTRATVVTPGQRLRLLPVVAARQGFLLEAAIIGDIVDREGQGDAIVCR